MEGALLNKFVINGGNTLLGSVDISGAKNAAVAIIPATLLAEGPCVLKNLPEISDVNICFHILKNIALIHPHTVFRVMHQTSVV